MICMISSTCDSLLWWQTGCTGVQGVRVVPNIDIKTTSYWHNVCRSDVRLTSDRQAWCWHDVILTGTLRNEDLFNTYRTNSTKSIDAWRTEMRWTVVDTVQRLCTNAMNLLGYKKISPNFNNTLTTVHDVNLDCLFTAPVVKCWESE